MNCSDDTADLRLEATSRPLIRLMLAMSAEWAAIAQQIETLGNAVCETAAKGGGARTQDLQAFDLIHQRSQGQANLLARLSRKLAEDEFFDRRRVGDLIADIPFESVRSGLEAAYEGRAAPAGKGEDNDDIEWL